MTLLGRLELVDFPRPSVARTLSPNGRAHHMAKYHAVQAVQTHVKVMATMAGLRPMRGLVTLQATYVVPVARKRDQDNYSTGVTKAVIDSLVRGGYLPDGDDTDHLRLLPVEIRVTKGVRMLVLEFEAESVLSSADQLKSDLDQPTNGRAPSGKTATEPEVFNAAQ